MDSIPINEQVHNIWLEVNPELEADSLHGRAWVEFLLELRRREQSQETIPEEIDNFLLILDECIAFFGCLQFSYFQELKNDKAVDNYEYRAIGLVAGSIAHYLFCLRTLSERGLDVGAKALGRVTSEYIDLLSLLVRTDLAEAFCKAQEPAEANRFWHQYLSKGKPSKDSDKLWEILGIGEKGVKQQREWEREENLILSASIHPSFMASYMASSSGSWGQTNVLGAYLGGFDFAQFRTIRYVIAKVLTFLSLHREFPFDLPKGALTGNGIMHEYERHGLRVIPKVCALALVDPTNRHFYRSDNRYAEGEL